MNQTPVVLLVALRDRGTLALFTEPALGECFLSAPDIFLSYNREDAERAKQFAEGFAAQGLDVWWDVALRSGEAYDEVTEAALRGAKAVVVLWSTKSVVSRWVRAEATLAERKKTLMPAMIEPCERPIMFELTQTADLSHWQGDTSDKAWQAFVIHLRDFVGKEASSGPGRAASDRPLPTLDQISIVVLPFANGGHDEEQEYFADGITEDVITDLGKVSALMVIARNTAFSFKGKQIDIGDVARQLNVTHVLEGSVRKAGKRVRVNVQLVDGSTSGQVWSERWDRDLNDIFELQDELSQEIVKALKVKLLPEESKALVDRPTTNIEAYDLYMRAKSAANAALDSEGFTIAVELFKKVLEIDPHFMPAMSAIATTSATQIVFAPEKREEITRYLASLLKDAAARSPDDSTTQLLLAISLFTKLKKDWFGIFAAFEKAMKGAASFETDTTAYHIISLMNVGRIGEAIELAEAARRVDPLSRMIRVILQEAYLCTGRVADCGAEYGRIKDESGNREDIEHIELFRVWGEGDSDAAKAQYRRYLKAQAIPFPEMVKCFDVLDQPKAALSILRDAFENPANLDGIRMLIIALHAGLHGDADVAVAALRRSFLDCGFHVVLHMWMPFMREARQTPAFKQLMRDLGIYDYWRKSGHWGDFARPVGDDDFEMIA